MAKRGRGVEPFKHYQEGGQVIKKKPKPKSK